MDWQVTGLSVFEADPIIGGARPPACCEEIENSARGVAGAVQFEEDIAKYGPLFIGTQFCLIYFVFLPCPVGVRRRFSTIPFRSRPAAV